MSTRENFSLDSLYAAEVREIMSDADDLECERMFAEYNRRYERGEAGLKMQVIGLAMECQRRHNERVTREDSLLRARGYVELRKWQPAADYRAH